MSEKEEVFRIIYEKIEAIDRQINYFESFGNKLDAKSLMKQAINVSIKSELISLKNDLTYGVGWRNENV